MLIRERPTEEHNVPGAAPTDQGPIPGEFPPLGQDLMPGAPGVIRPDIAGRIPSVPAQDLPNFGATRPAAAAAPPIPR